MSKEEALAFLYTFGQDRYDAWCAFEKSHNDKQMKKAIKTAFKQFAAALKVLTHEFSEKEQDTAPELLWKLGYFYCQNCQRWLSDKQLDINNDDCIAYSEKEEDGDED